MRGPLIRNERTPWAQEEQGYVVGGETNNKEITKRCGDDGGMGVDIQQDIVVK